MQEYIEFLRANPMLSLAWAGLFVALIVTTFKSSTSKVKNVFEKVFPAKEDFLPEVK